MDATNEVKHSVKWTIVGYQVKTYQACPGAPVQPGGCCENCGQGIKYVVTVKSNDGRTMEVGTDCAITLEGGPDLATVRRAEREYERARYLASPEYAASQARARKEQEERKARAAVATVEHAFELHGLDLIANSHAVHQSIRVRAASRASGIRRGDPYYELDGEDRTTFSIAVGVALAPASKHVGMVGEKITKMATLEFFLPLDTAYGISYLHKFRTTDGEVLVWFSKAGTIGRDDVGSTFQVTAKVKEHNVRDGEKQTIVTHLKVK